MDSTAAGNRCGKDAARPTATSASGCTGASTDGVGRTSHSRSTMTRIICLGNSTLDKVWLVAQLPDAGRKYRATDYFEVGGGMAANAAVAVARLDGNVAY